MCMQVSLTYAQTAYINTDNTSVYIKYTAHTETAHILGTKPVQFIT